MKKKTTLTFVFKIHLSSHRISLTEEYFLLYHQKWTLGSQERFCSANTVFNQVDVVDSFLSCDFLFQDSSEAVIQIRKVMLKCHDKIVYERGP